MKSILVKMGYGVDVVMPAYATILRFNRPRWKSHMEFDCAARGQLRLHVRSERYALWEVIDGKSP